MQKISWIRPQVILVTNCILHTLYTLLGSQFPTCVFISIVTPRIFNLREVYINIYIIINSLVKREAVKLQFFKISCLLRRKQAYQHLTSPTWPTTTPHVCQEKAEEPREEGTESWTSKGGVEEFCRIQWVSLIYFLTLLSKKGNISETMPKNWGNIKTAKERADQAWNKSGAAREHNIHRLERRKQEEAYNIYNIYNIYNRTVLYEQ